jgi:hypothetical protein
MEKVTLGLSYPFQKLSAAETRKRLSEFSAIHPEFSFVLHVGSNVAYKNRAGVLRIFAACGKGWNGRLVFAGEALSDSLRSLGHALGIADRIVELPGISSESLFFFPRARKASAGRSRKPKRAVARSSVWIGRR